MYYFLSLFCILAYVLVVSFIRRETSLETFDTEERFEFGDMFTAKVEKLKSLEKDALTSVIRAGYIDSSFEKYLTDRSAKELKNFKRAVIDGKVDTLYMIDFICREYKRSNEYSAYIMFDGKCKEDVLAYDEGIEKLYEELKKTEEYKFMFSYYQKLYKAVLEYVSKRNDDESYERAERLLEGINELAPSSDISILELIKKYKNPKRLLVRNILDEISFGDAKNIGIDRSKVTLAVSAYGNKIKNLEYIPAKNIYIYNVLKFGPRRRNEQTKRCFKNLFVLKIYARVFIKDKTLQRALKKCYNN